MKIGWHDNSVAEEEPLKAQALDGESTNYRITNCAL
jgi:hypothetical protein